MTSISISRPAITLHAEKFPGSTPHRGTLLFVHGKGVHLGRYRGVFNFFNQAGFTVLAYDQRGHGLSGGPRVFARTFEDYVYDLQAVTQVLGELPKPYFLVGHSMGALISLLFLQRGLGIFSRAALLSIPLVAATAVSTPKRWGVRLAALVSPQRLFKTGIDPCRIMKNREEIAARQADPLVTFEVTAPWFFAFEKAIAAVKRDLVPIQEPPVLVIHGEQDPLALPQGSHIAFSLCPKPASRLEILPGALHELLLDPEAPQILKQIQTFFTVV